MIKNFTTTAKAFLAKPMSRKILALVAVALGFFYLGRHVEQNAIQRTEPSASGQTRISQNTAQITAPNTSQAQQSTSIARAFEQQQSDIPVQGTGQIIKELADDNNGSRHQRILLKLPDGLTILIAHNIDLAPRVDNIKAGDSIEFKGEYAWNAKGGVVHWTHRDPNRRHPDGWLKHQNRTYQ